MKKLMALLLLSAVVVQMTGCAAMFHGTSDQITIQSTDPDTNIYMDNMLIGKGSAMTYVKRSTTHTLAAKKKGCADHLIQTQSAFDPVSLLGVLVDFGIVSMLVVDWGLTGAMFATSPTNYHLAPICDSTEAQIASKPATAPPSSREITITPPAPPAGDMVTISFPPDGFHTTQDMVQLIGVVRGLREIKTLDITVNGRVVRSGDARPTLNEGTVQPMSVRLPLEEGQNIIVVTAYETTGDVAQLIRTVHREAPSMTKADGTEKNNEQTGERWAVVIGIDQYSDNSIPALKYATADAKAMHSFLTTEGGVLPDHAVLLLDKQATQRKIRQTLGEFLRQKALKQDDVIIYYAGHGTVEADADADEGLANYLVPWDADAESLFSTAIPMEEIKQIFGRLAARKVLFLQDTCYSGGSGGRTFVTKRGNVRATSITSKFLQDLSLKQGRLIITASDVRELSVEDPKTGHGIFTYFLLEALRGAGDLDNDGSIRVRELHSYLDRRVHDQSGGSQTPQIFGDGDMVLSHVCPGPACTRGADQRSIGPRRFPGR